MTITAGTAHMINTGMALSSAAALAKETPTYCQLFPPGFGDLLDPTLGITRMADYRAHVVGDDGHFVSFEGFACRDDGEAIAKVQRLVDGLST
jgi:hypothetical protein